MSVHCPRCRQPVFSHDINVVHNEGHCPACDIRFALSEHQATLVPVAPLLEPLLAPAPTLARPADLAVAETRELDGLLLVLTPSRWKGLGVLGFALLWDSFLWVWYATVFKNGAGPAGMAVWFPLLHVAVGLSITYKAVTGLLNRAHLHLGPGGLRCDRRPLWQPGRTSLPLSQIVRIHSDMEQVSGEDGDTRHAIVQVTTADNRAIRLPLELASSRHASYLAGRLNQALDELRGSQRSYRS